MKSTSVNSLSYSLQAGELSLSGPALLELMRPVLEKGLPFRFCARGWSMSPFIRDGDVIQVQSLGKSLPHMGEVVAFIQPAADRLVIHRVVGQKGGSYLLQGDNSLGTPDGLVPPEAVLGRVIRVERHGHPVYSGLGLERRLIALLSRRGWLSPLVRAVAALYQPVVRK